MTFGPPRAKIVMLYAILYVIGGGCSFSSAYLQSNAATVWAPSGIALGLLLNHGLRAWPTIALSSFVLNLGNLLIAHSAPTAILSMAALLTACGNLAEAVLSAYLTETFAAGRSFPYRTRNVLAFVLLCAPLPPVLSALVGVGTDRLYGIPTTGDAMQIALIWYIANVQSIVLFGSIAVLSAHWMEEPQPPRKLLEGAGYLILLCLGVAIVGNLLNVPWLERWPRPYLLIPFVVWASFRFGSIGGMVSVLVITVAATAETINGYQIFPAETAWRSLMYLQVYLGTLSLIALTIGGALAERDAAAAELENQVNIRTGTIRAFLGHARLSTALAAHELKGPILELRRSLAGARAQIETAPLSTSGLGKTVGEAEATCRVLLDQIGSLLSASERDASIVQQTSATLEDIVLACFSAHRASARAKNVTLAFESSDDLVIDWASEAEQILNTLISNAIRHTPSGTTVRVSGRICDGRKRIRVSDEGPGIPPDQVDMLFRPPSNGIASYRTIASGRSGMGLYLARREAAWIGAGLTYAPTKPHGSTFQLEL